MADAERGDVSPVEAPIAVPRGMAETARPRRRFAERLVVDTSEKHPVYLLVGGNGSYIRLSSTSYHLLRQVDQGSSFAQLAEQINRRGENPTSASDVEAAYRKLEDKIAVIEARAAPPWRAFWFRRQLVSEAAVGRLAGALEWAFHPAVASGFAAVIAIAAYLLQRRGLHLQADHFISGYGLLLASMLAHELGHASACSRYGARPSEIGFGFYLFYPAFYSNVSSAWELKRWQRVVVDVAGAYFQLIVAAGFALAYLATGWEPLCLAVVMIVGACLFSLNPILKFDGYWLVADALGVTNLGQQPRRLLLHWVGRLRGQLTAALPWSLPVSCVLALYTVVSVGFWIWFLCAMLPLIGRRAVDYPALLITVTQQLVTQPLHPDTRLLRELFASTLMLAFMGLMWWRMLRPMLVKIRPWLWRPAGTSA